ncbi:MAG: polysaccharide deacetylase family protein [Oscillospiraceae bacterium]|jgi:peptidoglycan/xylan/chitin deacetylase (PgdA/CDA1 family)|nr:polysaccharide deacetylase family protein [Oscillospiraceae bacterium]
MIALRKRALCWALILCLLPGIGALAEEAPALDGTWSWSAERGWRYLLAHDMILSAEAQAVAMAYGLYLREGALPGGTALSQAQLLSVFFEWPGEALPTPPPRWPELSFFELNGEWAEEDDGTLMYHPGGDYAPMTVQQVFAALDTGDHGQPETPVTPNGKTIYLTVDDTPGPYTMELLAVLHNIGVPATFFIVGAYARQYPLFVRAIYQQGHGLANHSYTHNEDYLTASYRACLNDFKRCETAVAEALGFFLPLKLLRVPYGASTIPASYRTRLQEAGYTWIDWNALNGDAETGHDSDQDILRYAYETAAACKGDIVFLVHDAKKRTIRTLPEMVRHFREQGYTFALLTPELDGIEGVRAGWAYPQ